MPQWLPLAFSMNFKLLDSWASLQFGPLSLLTSSLQDPPPEGTMLFHDSMLCHISYSLLQIPFLHLSAYQLVLAFQTSTSSRKPFLPRLQLFSSVQSLSHVQLFATPWTAAHQDSLSITNSWSLLKLMSIELVMPSNHLILCHPFIPLPSIFPASGSFLMSQVFTSSGRSIGVSASASVLPMNIQDWFL